MPRIRHLAYDIYMNGSCHTVRHVITESSVLMRSKASESAAAHSAGALTDPLRNPSEVQAEVLPC